MSAEISATRVQECVRAALADEVVAIGGIETARHETGLSRDSITRRLAGTHAWTDADISKMVAAGYDRMGRSLVHQRLGCLLSSAPVLAGDGRRAADDVATALPALLSQAQIMAAALADRKIDRAEARTLLSVIPDLQRQLDSLQVDLAALLRSDMQASS